MHYFTHELRLELPELSLDRSVNVLTLSEPTRGTPCQIVINRDQLLGQETLEQCFERQISVMTRQTQAFKAVTRRRIEIGPHAVPALELESSFKQSGKTYHQLQAMFSTKAPALVVLTLSAHVPFNDGHRSVWKEALDSLELRPGPAA